MSLKDYLKTEEMRNVTATAIFKRFLQQAVGACEVVVAHHIIFIKEGELPNEIPSADTLLFSNELMTAVFGESKARMIMAVLASRPPEIREKVLEDFLNAKDDENKAIDKALEPKDAAA
jgi:hypothetical protein